MLRELVLKNRSYRRFHEQEAIPLETLRSLIDLARLTPSAANLQGIKYFLSCTPEMNAAIFPHLGWAGYLRDWPGPEEGERPSAYVVLLGDTTIAKDYNCDPGIVMQTLLLGAAEQGLGGCMIGSVKRDALAAALDIDTDRYTLLYVVALGKPQEKIVLEPLMPGDEVRYWRDENRVHHVPKRRLDDVIVS